MFTKMLKIVLLLCVALVAVIAQNPPARPAPSEVYHAVERLEIHEGGVTFVNCVQTSNTKIYLHITIKIKQSADI